MYLHPIKAGETQYTSYLFLFWVTTPVLPRSIFTWFPFKIPVEWKGKEGETSLIKDNVHWMPFPITLFKVSSSGNGLIQLLIAHSGS